VLADVVLAELVDLHLLPACRLGHRLERLCLLVSDVVADFVGDHKLLRADGVTVFLFELFASNGVHDRRDHDYKQQFGVDGKVRIPPALNLPISFTLTKKAEPPADAARRTMACSDGSDARSLHRRCLAKPC